MVVHDVATCPRCGKAHPGMKFKPLAKPFGRYNHWAPCPETKEPVMACVTLDLEYVEEKAKDAPAVK